MSLGIQLLALARLGAVAGSLLGATSALAQRTQAATDPLSVARALFTARETAASVAAVLKRDHAQTSVSTATLLRTVGYDAASTAGALKTVYSTTGGEAYEAMTGAGFNSTATTSALASAGIPVGLDCVDQQNQVIPCGAFGGVPYTPVTSQVAWTPTGQGFTDSSLTITGSNIPVVEVRIGSQTLTQVMANPGRVVVKLPSHPTQGPLSLRRTSDNVLGTLEPMYSVVTAPPVINWAALATKAITAATNEARNWLTGARIDSTKCTVGGTYTFGAVGVFGTATDFSGEIKTTLLQEGAPNEVAAGWDAGFRAAWKLWADAVTIPGLPWYPTFSVVPSSSASASQNVPTPLGMLVSGKVAEMAPTMLLQRIRTAIGPLAMTTDAGNAITSFATTISTKFAAFQLVGMVTNVQAKGPVPTYDPPTVPFGPVVKGTCWGLNVLGLAASSF